MKKSRVKKLDGVEAELTARWTWLREELARGQKLLQGEPGGDDTERAMSENEMSKQATRSEQLRDEMVQIEAAMGRIKMGTYGLCTDCGEEISERRLKAKRDATKCVDCQRQGEKNPPQRRSTDTRNW